MTSAGQPVEDVTVAIAIGHAARLLLDAETEMGMGDHAKAERLGALACSWLAVAEVLSD